MISRRWITVKEAALYLNVHEKTVYRLTYRRSIPFAKIPGVGIRIDKSGLDERLQSTAIIPRDIHQILEGGN